MYNYSFIVLFLFSFLSSQEAVLRVLIYDFPDLNNDSSRSWIEYMKTNFKRQYGIEIEIYVSKSGLTDVYDLENMKVLLGAGEDAFDIVEGDAALLGEMVDAGLLQEIDIEFSAQSVTYKGLTYGVPTMVCTPVVTEFKDFDQSAPKIIGNFRGSWVVPFYYISSYVNTHEWKSGLTNEALLSDPYEHDNVINNLKSFIDQSEPKGGQSNPCTDGDNYDLMVNDIIQKCHGTLLLIVNN